MLVIPSERPSRKNSTDWKFASGSDTLAPSGIFLEEGNVVPLGGVISEIAGGRLGSLSSMIVTVAEFDCPMRYEFGAARLVITVKMTVWSSSARSSSIA